jgi:hypothetical protein
MCAVQFLADRAQLAPFKLADLNNAPALRSANDRSVHQLEHGLLAERARNDRCAATLIEELPLEKNWSRSSYSFRHSSCSRIGPRESHI